MGPPSWNPVSRENCGESCSQQWKSIVAGNPVKPFDKMSVLAIQRAFQQEEDLSKLTNELETRREKFLNSTKERLDREIWELNENSTKEIKILTPRLIQFLEDIKSHLEDSNHFEEIIPSWKDQWDANIDQWSCDVREVLRTLQSRIVEALRGTESSLIDSTKFTAVQLEKFLNDQVIKLNHLIIVNERTYSEAERQLKLVFDTLLQKWLISYSYREIVATECEEIQEEESQQETKPVISQTVKIVDKIIAGLGDKQPEFDQISALNIYLDHLTMCQQHVKLHLKEALLHLKTHLIEKQEYLEEEESKLQLSDLWKEIVTMLKEQNDDFENYSKQAAYAWNQFLRRIHCAEHTATVTISKTRTAKLTRLLSSEEKMNTILDQLREGSSISNLEHIHNRITRELENAELSCLSCREDEEEVITKLVSACFSAYDIYSLQMAILQENSLNTDTDVYCVEVDLDDANELSDLELIRMRFCVYSAQTWIQGMKETLSMLDAELPKFLRTLLENVVSVYKGESEYWLMLQLEKLTRRKKRIRRNIFEIRASELQAHDMAQKHFQQVIDNELKKIGELIKEIKDELTLSDTSVVKYLDATKTDKLEGTPEKKIKHIKDEALIISNEQTRAQVVRKAKYEIERIFKWLEGTCFIYVNSLKLFHEGGNYCSEECDQILKKMSHLAKRLTRDAEKSIKKLDRVLTGTRESFKRKLGKIVYPDPSEDALLRAAEREANDRLNISFNRLKEMIKTETYKAIQNLKYLKESMTIAEQTNSFQKWHEAMNDVESLCNYFDLSKMFPVLELSILIGIAQMLSRQPHPNRSSLPDIAAARRKSKAKSPGSRVSIAAEGRKSRNKKSGVQKSEPSNASVGKFKGKRLGGGGQPMKKTSEALFAQMNTLDENNYLSNTKTLINEAHSRVKLIIAEAYNKYKVPIEKSEAQRNQAISVLQHYNLQCESVWTQFFDDYMNILLALCRSVLAYIFLLKDRHVYESVKSAMKLKADHKSNLARLNVEGLKEKIDNKLKPWHGYPLNKPLLQNLLKDVVSHCKDQLYSRKIVNETYKEELKALVADDKSKVVDILEDAKFFFLELYSNTAYQSFLEGIRGYVDSKEFGQSSVESAWPKAIQEYCSRYSVNKMSNQMEIDGQPGRGLEKYDDIGFNFLTGYKFWNFLPHMRNILNTLGSIQDEFQLPSPKAESFNKSISVQRSRSRSIHRSIEYSWAAGEAMAAEEAMGELDDEILNLPLWLKLKDDMNKHVEDFEAAAIKNLTQAKKEFDSVAWDLTRWKSEWISNIKEVNRLYLINPILDPPPKNIASDPAEYLRTKQAKGNQP